MACLIKVPGHDTKGIFTLTTQERDKLVYGFSEIRGLVEGLKDKYLIGLHHNWHDPSLTYDPLFDFHLAGAEDLTEVNGAKIPLIPMDACNFSPNCFYPSKGEKFWDILFVARAVEFKGIPEFFKAVRKIYDGGNFLRILFICPVPPNSGAGIVDTVRQEYDNLFTEKEQDFFTLLTLNYRYPFPFDLPTLAQFYRASKIFVHSAPDERRCRVAAYAWATELPVVGMSSIGSVLSKELRRPPYFYETNTYDDFPSKILQALDRLDENCDFIEVKKEISSKFSVDLFESHLERIYVEKNLKAPGKGGWFSELDIRLGRHHGIPAGNNAVNQDISGFLRFLGSPIDKIQNQLHGINDPEMYIGKNYLVQPRVVQENTGPGLVLQLKQIILRCLKMLRLRT